MQLNPVTYNYNELTGYDELTRQRTQTGFVAQELQQVFPEMVGNVTINGTDYYDTNLSNLQIYLLKGLQEQQGQINNILNTLTTLNVQGITGDNVQVNNDINVLGTSTFNDVTVTGELKVGSISIDSLTNSLQIVGPNCSSNETLCQEQTLKLQNNLAGNVDIFNGKMVLETDGTMTIQGTLNAEKVNAKEYNVDLQGQTIGSGTLPKGDTSVFIESSVVKGNSKIFITPTSDLGENKLTVTEKRNNEGFEVSIEEVYNNDIQFDWWVITNN